MRHAVATVPAMRGSILLNDHIVHRLCLGRSVRQELNPDRGNSAFYSMHKTSGAGPRLLGTLIPSQALSDAEPLSGDTTSGKSAARIVTRLA